MKEKDRKEIEQVVEMYKQAIHTQNEEDLKKNLVKQRGLLSDFHHESVHPAGSHLPGLFNWWHSKQLL